MTAAEMGGPTPSSVKRLQRYSISKLHPEINVNIWESCPLTREACSIEELELTVDGKMPQNCQMGQSIHDPTFRDMLEKAKTRKTTKTQMHGILIFVLAQSLQDRLDDVIDGQSDDVSENQYLRAVFQLLSLKGYKPVVIIGKADEVCRGLRGKAMEQHKNLEKLRHKAATYFDVSLSRVHHAVNYTEERETTFDIDSLAYQTLDYSLQLCRQFEAIKLDEVSKATWLLISTL